MALEISSWLPVWLWKILGCLCCRQFTASYIFSRITCFAWTGGSGTIVPSLPERTAGWHITTQTYPYSGRQCHPLLALQSHGPLFGMLLCLFDKMMEMVISPHILGLWMMGHNVARWDNSSINHADQREDANRCCYYIFFSLVSSVIKRTGEHFTLLTLKTMRKIWILDDDSVKLKWILKSETR